MVKSKMSVSNSHSYIRLYERIGDIDLHEAISLDLARI
jgi:hypothetical protein